MARAKPDDSIHINLVNPIDKRKAVLVTTISTVELLARYEKIRELRKLKMEALDQFHSVLGELKKLSKEIRLKEMPLNEGDLGKVKNVKQTAPALPLQNVPSPSLSRGRGKIVVPKKQKSEDLRKSSIDNQLAALRAKLDTL